MLRYIKGHMESIIGIEIFPLISFVLFLTFFALVALWVWKLDKGHVHQLENLPLGDDEITNA